VRKKYGSRAWSWFPVKPTLIVLDGAGIDEVLGSPANFADPLAKTHFLTPFTPHGVIVSQDPDWTPRRTFNVEPLAFGKVVHPDGARHVDVINDEVMRMLKARPDVLGWDDFSTLAARISQQVIFGNGEYREDVALHLARLVAASNWGIRRCSDFTAFYERIGQELNHRGPARTGDSLVQEGARCPARHHPDVEAASQMAFWLFVMKDAIELHTVRTLTLIASASPEVRERLSQERGRGPLNVHAIEKFVFLEACIKEQLRLWTPVPILLRRAVEPFVLGDLSIEKDQQLLLHTGFYHRDTEAFGPGANKFCPEQRVLTDRPNDCSVTNSDPQLYVFSRHRQACAGQFLIIFLLKSILAALLTQTDLELLDQSVAMDPVPDAIDPFAMRFWRRKTSAVKDQYRR